ncbi:MAG: NADH-quinone oxidoreductase subunit J [Pseudanabaenaceae cyanobacterium]
MNLNLTSGVQLVSLLILSATLTGSAMAVVISPNIVYSAFLLGLSFISVSGLYILLNGDFVAAAQVLIYVGAVNVLILFAIMLVNKKQPYRPLKLGMVRNLATAVVCVGLFALLTVTVTSTPWQVTPTIAVLPSTLVVLAQHFFSDYLLPFELASVLLLIALIGAIILARREFLPDRVPTAPDEAMELLERPKQELLTAKRK